MMLGPLLLPRPSSLESPWIKFCQPATESHTIPSHSSICVAWADSELFHLGPVVAAQQVHHQAQK